MWCPGIAALLSCKLLRRDFAGVGWNWPRRIYVVTAYMLPVVYASVAYGGIWLARLGGWNAQFVKTVGESFGLRGLPASASLVLYIVMMATGGLVLNLSTALGEEIGWRGFLVPELAKRMSFTKTSLVSGVIWAAWHAPLVLFSDYSSGPNRGYALTCSTITVISLSFVLAWFRLKSESVWPAALLHASHNLFVPGVLFTIINFVLSLFTWMSLIQ